MEAIRLILGLVSIFLAFVNCSTTGTTGTAETTGTTGTVETTDTTGTFETESTENGTVPWYSTMDYNYTTTFEPGIVMEKNLERAVISRSIGSQINL